MRPSPSHPESRDTSHPKPGPVPQAKRHKPGPPALSGAKKIFSFSFLLNSGSGGNESIIMKPARVILVLLSELS